MTASLQKDETPPPPAINEYPGYEIEPSDGEAPV